MSHYVDILASPFVGIYGLLSGLAALPFDSPVIAVLKLVAIGFGTVRFLKLADEGIPGSRQPDLLERKKQLLWALKELGKIVVGAWVGISIVRVGINIWLDLYENFPIVTPIIFAAAYLRSYHVADGKVILYAQPWMYDILGVLFYPFNQGVVVYGSTWATMTDMKNFHTDPTYSVEALKVLDKNKMEDGSNRMEYVAAALKNKSKETFEEIEIVRLFDSLPAIDADDMYHHWRGHIVHTGSLIDIASHVLMRFLGIQWGKRFRNKHVGDPLVVNIGNKLLVPAPVWGNVCMIDMTYRGVSTATMVYDNLPFQDYFKVIDEGDAKTGKPKLLLGVWTARDKVGGWFMLEGMPEFDAVVGLENHRVPLSNK